MSVASVVRKRQKPCKIKRASQSKEVKLDGSGRPIRESSFSSDTVLLHYQPLGAKEVSRLPEGERNKELLSVWTLDDSVLNSDRVAIKGFYYQLNGATDWAEFTIFTATKTGESSVEEEE